MQRENLNWRSPLGPSCWKLENPSEGSGECRSRRGWRAPGEHGSQNQLGRGYMNPQRLKWQAWDPPGSTPDLLCMLWLLTWCFCGIPNNGSCCISDSFACSWHFLFSYWVAFPALIWEFLSGLIVSCFALLGCCLLEAFRFLNSWYLLTVVHHC